MTWADLTLYAKNASTAELIFAVLFLVVGFIGIVAHIVDIALSVKAILKAYLEKEPL